MSQDIYELLALGARYVFAALMVLIVLRAWRITLVDSRRADTLRRMSPQTGLSGELVVLEGSEKARRGMRYPVIREGMIGSSRRADIRIRHSSVRRRHAYFQLAEEGLSLRSHAGASLRDGEDQPARALLLGDGDEFSVGNVRLLLVLTAAPEPTHRRHERRGAVPEDDYDDVAVGDAPEDLIPEDPDALFDAQPAPRREMRRRARPAKPEEHFDTDEDGW